MTLDAIGSSEILPIDSRHINESFLVKGIADPSGACAANLALQALAYQSGGIVVTNTKDIAGQIARSVADLDSYYKLTFHTAPAARYGEYHALAVKVAKPGLAARTRTVYYGEQ